MTERKRVTLRDIAEKTGFTVNTVSRGLKGCADISAASREVIRKAADELGYVGDAVASSLRSGYTKTIAVIVGDISNPFFGAEVKNTEKEARRHDWTVVVYNTDESAARERSAILSAYGRRADGILLCPSQQGGENLDLLEQLSLPYVLMGRHFPGREADSVCWDDRKGGRLAAEYFLRRGHRRILFMGGPPCISSAAERLQGYRDAFAQAGLPAEESLLCENRITGSCAAKLREIIRSGVSFTAAVAFSDLMALEILTEFRKAGLAVPVAAFDHIRAEFPMPADFPSVGCCGNQPAEAVELLYRRIHGLPVTQNQICLDVKLFE